MNIQTILALTDLSERGLRTVERAAFLAQAHGALLKIMYAAERFAAPADADAALRLGALCLETAEGFAILVKKVDDASGSLDAAAEEARWCDLIVIGDEVDRSLAAFFHGQPAERLLRHAAKPVLVSRGDAAEGNYARILVAVDLRRDSGTLVDMACAFDGTAEVEMFHAFSPAYEGKLRYADVSTRIIEHYRETCARHARERLLRLSDASSARRNRVVTAIGRGDPAHQLAVQQQFTRADLLVVGKRRRSALADFLCGSVAQRVLRAAASDVLVVPHDAIAQRQGRIRGLSAPRRAART
jgi:nucleotide-binding universal stress UspA family protein